MCRRSQWMALALVVLALPALAAAPPDMCATPADASSAVEAPDASLDEASFLDDDPPGSECGHVSGCGFIPRYPGHDAYCAAKCSSPVNCGNEYPTGWWQESSGCCICVAV